MIYIGIDAAKDKHDCHFVNSDGEVLLDNLRILNNLDGFNKLKQAIEQFSTGDNTQIRVGLESTGSYSANIISFLKHLNLSVTVLNPYNVANLRPATTLRKTKTDKSDARLIATATALCAPNQTYLDISYHIQTLKSLCRSRYRLIKIIQPIKNRFRRILHVMFPEFETLFDVSINSSYKLLKRFPGPKAILHTRKSSLEKLQAFAGLAPMLYESGKYIARDTPMDKKGSVYLRNALYQATNSSYVLNSFMRSYVDKKRAQGKHFYTATSHGMKKMVRVIFAVLKKNSNFVEPII